MESEPLVSGDPADQAKKYGAAKEHALADKVKQYEAAGEHAEHALADKAKQYEAAGEKLADKTQDFQEDLEDLEKGLEDPEAAMKALIKKFGETEEPDALPKFADLVNKVDEWHKKSFEPAEHPKSKPNELHLNHSCPIVFRQMSKLYLELLQHSSQPKSVFSLSKHKAELLNAIQAAESLQAALVASPSFWTAFNSKVMVLHPAHLTGEKPQLSELDKHTMQLLKILFLYLLYIQPADKTLKGESLFDLKMDADKHFADKATRSLVDRGKEEEAGKSSGSAKAHPKLTCFGLDRAWLKRGMDSDVFFMANMRHYLMYFKGPERYYSSKAQDKRFSLYEQRAIGCYMQMLSQAIAHMKHQSDVATHKQAKILSAISTTVFTVVTFVFNYWQRGAHH